MSETDARQLFDATIHGVPRILKNRKTFISKERKDGSKFSTVIPNKPAEKAIEEMLEGLLPFVPSKPVTGPIRARFLFIGPWKPGNEPDLSNLYQLPEDVMQKAGIIEDDQQIESHDGSRRVGLCLRCPHRDRYVIKSRRGQFKPDNRCTAWRKKSGLECTFARTRITLFRFDREQDLKRIAAEVMGLPRL